MRRSFQIFSVVAVVLLGAMIFRAWLASRDEQLRLQSVIKTQSQLIEAANSREHDRAAALDQTLTEIDKLKRETQTPQQILAEIPKYLPLPEPITMGESGDSSGAPVNGPAETRVGADNGNRAGKEGSLARANAAPLRALNSLEAKVGAARCALIPSKVQAGLSSTNAKTAESANYSGPSNGHERVAAPSRDNNGLAALPSSQNSTGDRADSMRSPVADADATSSTNANTGPAEIPAADLKPLYDYVQDCRACRAQLSAAKQDHIDDTAKLVAVTRERDAAVTASKGGSVWRRLRRNAAWFAIGAAAAATTLTVAAAAHHATR